MTSVAQPSGLRKGLKQWIWRLARRPAAYTALLMHQSENWYHCQKAIQAGILKMGRHSYGYPRIIQVRDETGMIEIGSFCSLASRVTIFLGGNHQWWVTTYPIGDAYDRPDLMASYNQQGSHTVIGSDVWIGRDATILDNLTIGHGAVIGAQAVVARDVPPFAIVVGNPAQVVRYRFEQPVIEALLRIRWWDWDDEKIEKALPQLASSDVTAFVRAYDE